MRFVTLVLLAFQFSLSSIEIDFDVAIVGTSPVSMLEAICHLARNERVLVVEADEKYGGAWKSIDACGIAHADLGCHQIGSDLRIKKFFQTYFDCKFICLDHPAFEAIGVHAQCPNGFYFSGGCHELVTRLKDRLDSYPHAHIAHQKLESIFVDTVNGYIELSLGDLRFTTAKLKVTAMSHFRVSNLQFVNKDFFVHYYPHLYVLIEDEGPFSFTYLPGIIAGMVRAMNLTPFVDLPMENMQLIVFQTQTKEHLNDAQRFIDALKGKGFLTDNAQIVTTDTYTYQQSCMNIPALQKFAGSLVEVLDTSSFAGMARHLDKWQACMTPCTICEK